MTKSSKILLWAMLGVVLVLILSIVLSGLLMNGRTEEVDNTEFFRLIETQTFTEEDGTTREVSVDEIRIDLYNVSAIDRESKEENSRVLVIYKTTIGRFSAEYERIIAAAEKNGIKVNQSDPNEGSWISYLIPLFGIVLVCVVFWLLIRQTQGGSSKAMNYAKNKARVNSNIKVRFSDVAGAEEEKAELAEVVDFLKSPRKFSELGARIPRGILLVGPPGTGKTLFAKAVAGEANVPFFSISGSDFVEMFVGVGASRVRDLFDAAKKSQPCIVFIDEIDAVGRQRGTGLGGGHDEREQTLNQLLVQMDGFETNDGIIVMAATNRADILDPALLRPGRFDRQIHVNLPDVRGREQILKVHARNKPLAPDVNFKILARMTSGFSGADLENLLNEAAILTARANKKMIGNSELFEGINKVLLGPQKKSRLVTESDKRITAYHESGHAIIAKLCKHCDPVQEVSIIGRGMAAGYTMTRPDNDDNHITRAKLLDLVCELLGGRVAEELVIQDVSTGASNDLQRVTEIARKMVTEWGMSERVGLVTYKSDNPIFLGRDMEAHSGYSEETAGLIDEEVHSIIDAAHERAVKLLTEHRKVLDNMARVLIERETIYTDEVDLLLDGASVDEVYAFMDKNEKAEQADPFRRYAQKEEKEAAPAPDDKASPSSGQDGGEEKPAGTDPSAAVNAPAEGGPDGSPAEKDPAKKDPAEKGPAKKDPADGGSEGGR